jgi:ABC-type bacteriocin/lantibiotic exporter with double-glycine peptidase domain
MRDGVTGALLAVAMLMLFGSVSASEGISLPWLKQKTASDCGRAVLASLATRDGDAGQTYQKIPEPKHRDGYSLEELVVHAKSLNLKLSPIMPSTILAGCSAQTRNSRAVKAHFAKVSETLRNGRPVLILRRTETQFGHYVILTGTREDRFVVHDPAEDGPTEISFPSLADQTCASGYLALRVD